LHVNLKSGVGPYTSQPQKSSFTIYTLVKTFWYIETIVYDVIPIMFDVTDLSDPGEKKIKRIFSAAILDAILILLGMNIYY